MLSYCDEADKKIHICHYDEDEDQFKTLCVSLNGAMNGLLKTHPEDYCGECDDDDDPLNQDIGPVTYPFLTLLSPSPYTFNSLESELCVELSNAVFDMDSVALVVNGQTESPTAVDDTLSCISSFLFDDGLNEIAFTAVALNGTNAYNVTLSREIHAGANSITVNLHDETLGNPYTGDAVVETQLSDNELVKSNKTSGTQVYE